MWQYHPILLVFQLGAILSAGVAVYSAHRVWRHGYSLIVASPALSTKLWMYKLEFIGTALNPSVALALMLAHLGRKRWLTRPVIGVLVAVPVVIW